MTLRVPVVADSVIVISAVTCVALLKIVELVVIPKPLKLAKAPDAKPVPVIIIDWDCAPLPRLVGLADVTVGAGPVVTTTDADETTPNEFTEIVFADSVL